MLTYATNLFEIHTHNLASIYLKIQVF